MTAETHLYFPLEGHETSAYVKVRLYDDGGKPGAQASLEGPAAEGARFEYPTTGEPHAVLRDARDYAAGRGFDVRVQLDGVAWNPELGVLVEPKT
ncbi:hypothetical protein [Aureimonas sp. Leaf454]|uniref:hypothetical protein n=1 Tax=Aureimonas sp. Leaf454 TaxID=1736381 RepID=UPI000AFA9901|nr:hypothetical protein [Aureimonas sp. Leaf454]